MLNAEMLYIIIKPFSVSGLAGLFSSHPPTADRVAALLHARA